MKKFVKLTVLIVLVALFATILCSCNNSNDTLGKYYEEKSDGTLKESSWIELLKKDKWQNEAGETGTYEIDGTTIKFFIDGEEWFNGTIQDGVMVVDIFGEYTYRKEVAGSSDTTGNENITESASVTKITGGTVSGLNVFLEVADTIENVDLSGMLTVSSGSSWQLYSDITGQTIIPTKYAASLKNGDNVYYVVVNSDDGKTNRTYTLTIFKNFYVTITYQSAGATYKTEQVMTHTTMGEGDAITREGYTFGGWSGLNGYYVTETKTFTAQWTANTYTVTLDANGGNSSSTVKDIIYESVYDIPVPSRTGYTFGGWYTSASGGNQLTDNRGDCKGVWFTAGNTTVYAHWSINSYNVTANKNIDAAGTVSGGGSKTYNGNVTLTANTNSGYTWLGWYSGETKVSTGTSLNFSFTMTDGDRTYIAKWIVCPVTIARNISAAGTVSGLNGKVLGASETITATTNNGYTWLGWYDGETKVSEGTNLTYTFIMTNVIRIFEARWAEYKLQISKNLNDAGDISIVGNLSTTVTFDLNGATGTPPEAQVLSDNSLVYPPIPIRGSVGYLSWAFGGWFTSAEPSGIEELYDFTKPVTEDITLYACWMECSSLQQMYNIALNSEKNISSASTERSDCFIALSTTTYTLSYRNQYSNRSSYLKIQEYSEEGEQDIYDTGGYFSNTTYESIQLSVTAGNVYFITTHSTNNHNIYLKLNGSLPPAGGKSDLYNSVIVEGEEVEIAATTNTGYTWLGWYDGEEKVSTGDSLTYTFTMPAENKTYTAKWGDYNITLEKNINEAGNVSGSGKFVAGTECTVTAVTNSGYTWLGWYDGESKVSDGTSLTYTFNMPSVSKTYTAKWLLCPVTLEKNIDAAGGVNGVSGATVAGDDCTITATTNVGYTWLGWYDGEEKVSTGDSLTYTFTMPSVNKNYTAKWGDYNITLDKNMNEAGSISGSSGKIVVGTECTVTATTNMGYTWLGWYDGDTLLSNDLIYTFIMPFENRLFSAHWTEYSVTISKNNGIAGTTVISSKIGVLFNSLSFDLNGGSGEIIQQTTGETIYPSIVNRAGYIFTGWYDDPDCTKLYDFTAQVTEAKTVYAGWYQIQGNSSIILNGGVVEYWTSTQNKYHYFAGLSDGIYTLHFRSPYNSSGVYNHIYVYDITNSQVLLSDQGIGTEYSSVNLQIIKSHIYYIKTYGYLDHTGPLIMYLTGNLPVAGGLINNDKVLVTANNEVTLQASTNNGYTWLGWYDGEEKVSTGDSLTYTFTMPSENKTYTAKWGDYNITLEKNINEAGSISGSSGRIVAGTECTVIAITNTGYTWLGWYEGESKVSDGTSLMYTFTMPSVNKNYTAKWGDYNITLEKNINEAGSISGSSGRIVAGTECTVTAITNTGYTWLGWHDGEITISTDTNFTYIFTMPFDSKIYTAKWQVSSEMENFIFASTSITCTITDCIDTTVTSILVPDYVTSIGDSAFNGCSYLTEMTLPFVGGSSNVTIASSSTLFGYIFGSLSYIGGIATNQYYASYYVKTYYIPSSLTSVTITGGNVLYGAFYNCTGLTSVTIPNTVTSIGSSSFYGCSGLTSIVIPDSVSSIGEYAFTKCIGLTSVYITDIVAWCGIYFSTGYSNPLYYADNLYLDGVLTTNIMIPDSVTSIGINAFYGFSGLTSITLSDSVTSIGRYAFYDCSSLTSITISDSVTSIGCFALCGCSGLTSITLPFVGGSASATTASSSTLFGYIFGTLSYIGGTLTTQYYASGSYATYYIPSSMRSVTITGGNILYGAFYGCTELTSATIPDSVTSIGSSAFYGCSGLTSIVLSNSVTSIGSSAFYGCSGLTSIVLSNSVTSIGEGAFHNCTGLTYMTLPFVGGSASATTASSSTLFGYIFGTTSYTDVTEATQYYASGSYVTYYIPSSLRSVTIMGGNILYGTFYNCIVLTSIIIPETIESIPDYAFYGCSNLENVNIPDSIVEINSSAFIGCDNFVYDIENDIKYISKWIIGTVTKDLTNLFIRNDTIGVAGCAFDSCSELTSVTFPTGVDKIGYKAFKGCSALTSMVLPNGNTTLSWIGASLLKTVEVRSGLKLVDNLFYGCDSLTSIILPSGLLEIGKNVFSNCANLTTLFIPESVTNIGVSAFEACTNLIELEIPQNVTYIPEFCFNCCANLKTVILPNGLKTIGYRAFSYCSNLEVIYLPGGLTEIQSGAFSGCSALESLCIPVSVQNMGNKVFSECGQIILWTSLMFQPENWDSSWWGYEATVYFGALSLYEEDDMLFVIQEQEKAILAKYKGTSNVITIPSTITLNNNQVVTIGKYAFYNYSGLTSIIIGSGVTSMDRYAFYGCSELTSITIPDSVIYIGDYVFCGCSGLTSITIPDSVTSIDSHAFNGCIGLTSITIPDSVTSICSYAFNGCIGLTSITIPDSVTSICSYAFNGCIGLTSITIPDSVTSICSYAFQNCTNLISVTFSTTTGWYVTEDYFATSGTSITVTNASTIATYLKSTYRMYYWKRNA